jgi:IclR family transcriptional regulator, acetate operon repressor
MDTNETTSNSVRSVQRALRLLSVLGPTQPNATLTEFAHVSGLATSTVQRLLLTLEQENFLKRLPDGRYTFGVTLVQLGLSALQGIELYDIAKPYLDALSQQTGETANLAVLDEHGRVLYLRQSLSRHPISHTSWLGRPFEAEGTAIGAVLVGHVDHTGVVSTRHTTEPNATAIAAPIHDASGAIVAGFGVSGPTYRISDADLVRFSDVVATTARAVTIQLGGRWPYADSA